MTEQELIDKFDTAAWELIDHMSKYESSREYIYDRMQAKLRSAENVLEAK